MAFHGGEKVLISLSLHSVASLLAHSLTLPHLAPPLPPQIDQGTLGVPDRKYLLKGTNDTVVKAYLETMVDTAMALGAKDKDRIEREMKQVLDFEIQLANVSHQSSPMYLETRCSVCPGTSTDTFVNLCT